MKIKTDYHKFQLFLKVYKKQTNHKYTYRMLNQEIQNIRNLDISNGTFIRFMRWALGKKRLKNTYFLLALLNEYRARSEKDKEEEIEFFFNRLKKKKELIISECKKCKGRGFRILKKNNDEEYIRIADCICVKKFKIYSDKAIKRFMKEL